jgi:hypothetical protein
MATKMAADTGDYSYRDNIARMVRELVEAFEAPGQ